MNAHLAGRCLALLLALASFSRPADAAPTAEFWEEIGGSATGAGISASELGAVPEHRNTSVVIGPDRRPIIAYTDWADTVVRRWNGVTWEIIGQPGGGHLPQLVFGADGRLYYAWMAFVADSGTWEVYLVVRDPVTGEWAELGGSATGGGISGADGPANVNSFSFAVGPDGTVWVAYDTTAIGGADLTTEPSGIAPGSQQTYVRRWPGGGLSEGWMYVGGGRDTGGAGNAVSFALANADGSANLVTHDALRPAITVEPDGTAVVAFVYTTSFSNGDADEFNGLNDDIYAVRWDGRAWVAMGPAVPTTPAGAGLGAPGGISASSGWSNEPYLNLINAPQLIIGRDGATVLGWGETTGTDDTRRMLVRRWTGSAWVGVGSAGGEIARSASAFDISLAPGVNGPLAAWSSGAGSDSSVYVLGFDARTGRWAEVGRGSATGAGISGPSRHGFTPWITVDAAGTPTVTWIEALDTETGGQVFARTFESRVLPDLTVTGLTAPATARTGGAIAIANTVRNLGAATSPASLVRFYLATATVRGAGDIALGSRPVAALAVNGTSATTTPLTIPATVEPGTYHVLAVVDEAAAASERNESNNVRASAAMTVTLFRPELTLAAVTVPAGGAAGRPLAITSTVRNQGPAPAGAFAVRFFLSTDDTRDDGDVLLGTRSIAALGAGAVSTAVTTVTIPATTDVPGTYHVLGVVDALDQQVELDEDNNVVASGPVVLVPYRPELAMAALTTPAMASPGRPLALTSTVRNAGPAPAGGFVVRFVLSADDTVEGALLLGQRVVAGLAVGAASSVVSTFTIPAATPIPGTYRVIGIVDALEQQLELDEDDNVTRAAATIALTAWRPDLTVSAVTLPAAGAVGRPLAITNTVKNVGPAPAGAFSVRFYLSADDTLDPADALLGTRVVPGLAAGALSTAVTTLTIPGNTSAPADYRVITVVDALGQQVELSESNNALASIGSVAISLYRPDLTVAALTIPATGATGRPLAIANTMRNAGPAPAGPFSVRFYLSADDTFDAGDVLLGTRALAGLAAGATSPAVTTLTIPGNTSAPGTYRVIAVVDALGQQIELNEANNARASTAIVSVNPYRPELGVATLTMPAAAAVGRPLAITSTVRNTGPAPAGPFSVRFYLSADTTLDPGDALLGARVLTGLAAGATSSAITTVTIAANTSAPATYHVIAAVDALGQQVELDEANNTLASTGTVAVTLFRPDLALTSVSAPATAVAGNSLAITHTTRNVGPAPTIGPFTVRFYLSADAALDPGDVLLGAREIPIALAAGGSRTDVTTVTVPAGALVPPTYHVIGVVDALDQQAETAETNNVTASGPISASLAVTVSGTR